MPICVFVGLDRAGKSSIKVYLETLNIEIAKNTKMSNGIEVYQRGGLKIEVFPGQRRLRYNEKLYQVYFGVARKIVFVVDSADHERFDEVRRYWDYVMRMVRKYCGDVEIVFVAHKRDLEGSIPARELYGRLGLDSGGVPVKFVDTTIYDPWSIAGLLKVIHGGDAIRVDDIVETLRRLCDAELAFIYDGHILPLAFSPKKLEGDNIIVYLNDVICSLEKIGQIKAFVGVFEKRKLGTIAVGTNKERIIVGVYGFKTRITEALEYCRQTALRYMNQYRGELW